MWHYRGLLDFSIYIKVAGIIEGGSDEDTNTIVQKIISDIDPDLSPTDIERSHRIGKLGDSRGLKDDTI
jgi:hypothetical protein